MTTTPQFKVGDEVVITLPPEDIYYPTYDGKVGTITRIEDPEVSYSGFAGYYVNCAGLTALRARVHELTPYTAPPTTTRVALDNIPAEHPDPRPDPVDTIRKAYTDATNGDRTLDFVVNSGAYVAQLLAIIDGIEAECSDSEAHAIPYGDSAVVYTEVIRDIIRQRS